VESPCQRDDGETSLSAGGLPRGEEDLERTGIHIGSLGDAGEMLDDQAKSAYRRRLSDLRFFSRKLGRRFIASASVTTL
jgi:hypothetical protein